VTRSSGHLSRPRLISAVVGTLGFIASAHAGAQPFEPVDLTWNAPSACPSAQQVRARVRKLAGPLTSTATAKPSAEALVTRNPEGNFHLRLTMRVGTQTGERNIDGKSCDSLAGATAVALVLLLRSSDPLAEWDIAPQPTTSTDPPPKTGSTPIASPDTKPVSDGPRRNSEPSSGQRVQRRWHVLLQVPQGSLAIGPLRQAGLGTAIAGGLAFDKWRFLARGTFWFRQHVSTTSDQGGESFGFTGTQEYGADINRATGSLLACRALWLSRLELAPCLKVSLEHLSARGAGAHIAARTDSATWFAGGFGAHARAYLAPWLSVVLAIEGELESSTPQLSLDGVRRFERLIPAAATVTVGAEWIL
jgi:hypothetical protein